jgi:hypothetical protein
VNERVIVVSARKVPGKLGREGYSEEWQLFEILKLE